MECGRCGAKISSCPNDGIQDAVCSRCFTELEERVLELEAYISNIFIVPADGTLRAKKH